MHLKLILSAVLCVASLTAVMADVKQIVRGNEKFGKALYNVVAKKDGNLVASPFSAHVVLSMAYSGAAGKTAEAFRSVLGVGDADATAEQYHELMAKVRDIKNVTLNLANKIFIMDKFELQPKFENTLKQKYLSDAQSLNFAENVKSAQVINHWVEDKTNKKIKDLIKPDMLDALTRLVLVNAVYFKGNWAHQFKKEQTREEPFHLLDGTTVPCQMMHINQKFNYMESDVLKAKVLELPYSGNEMSMLIFLPNEVNGLPHLEKNIEHFDFSNFNQNMGKWEVDVALPKFKIESEIPLTEVLKEMGLGEIFSDLANFSLISKNGEDLKVSEVIQKAFIEVNEEGAEAAAATGVVFALLSAQFSFEPPKSFVVDRPFMFALVAKEQNNNMLFVGHVQKL